MPLIESQPDEVAQVYARSLYELAGGREQAETILGELQELLELARQDPKFSEFLASKALPIERRDGSLRAILEGRASDLTVRFLRLLNRKGRLGHLPAIVEAYDHIVQEAFGRVEVDIYTVEALDPEDRDRIREKVQATIGKEIVLHEYVEPAMLGGVKLKIGDQLIDDSLQAQLRRARQRLLSQGGSLIRERAARIIDAAAETPEER